MRFQPLIETVVEVLRQEYELLQSIDDGIYSAPGSGCFTSSIGAHIRHNLDHFTAFFSGLREGYIDYGHRDRDITIAESSAHAKTLIQRYIKELKALHAMEEYHLKVRDESGAESDDSYWLESSLGRELQFLLGHTVHHHAIIAIQLHEHGVSLPEGFGVAPSTQRHLQRQKPESV